MHCISSWIYEKVLSKNTSTLTTILLNRALNESNGPESDESEREEGKEEGEREREREKKTEHSYVFISSTLEIVCERQKTFPGESYSVAGLDGQQRAHPRAEVISIVFINPARNIAGFIKT